MTTILLNEMTIPRFYSTPAPACENDLQSPSTLYWHSIPATRDPPCPGRLPAEGFTMEPKQDQSGQDQPPKKRRRRLIVAVVLVLVSIVSWWQWPRGDARFVGKWAATEEPDAGQSVLTFHSSGTLLWDRKGAKLPTRSAWRVENDRLILGSFAASSPMLDEIVWQLRVRLGIYWIYRRDELMLKMVTPDRIVFETVPDRYGAVSRVSLSRIPE